MLTQIDEKFNLGRWRMATKVRSIIDRIRSGDSYDLEQIANMRSYVTVCVSLEDASLSAHCDRLHFDNPDQIFFRLKIWEGQSIHKVLTDKLEDEILQPLLDGVVESCLTSEVAHMVQSWSPELLLIKPSDIVTYLKLSNSRNLSYMQAKGILYRLSGSMSAVDAVLDEFDSSGLHLCSNREKLLELIKTVDQWGA